MNFHWRLLVKKSCELAHMVSVNYYSSTEILLEIQGDVPSLNLNWQQHPDGGPSQSRGRAKKWSLFFWNPLSAS